MIGSKVFGYISRIPVHLLHVCRFMMQVRHREEFLFLFYQAAQLSRRQTIFLSEGGAARVSVKDSIQFGQSDLEDWDIRIKSLWLSTGTALDYLWNTVVSTESTCGTGCSLGPNGRVLDLQVVLLEGPRHQAAQVWLG